MLISIPLIIGIAGALIIVIAYLLVDRARIKKRDETKTEFLSIASHHVRTPLTLMKWTLTEFLEGNYGSFTDEQKKMFRALTQRSEELIRFVHALLDVTRIESKRTVLHFGRMNMTAFLDETVGKLMPLAEDRGIRLSKNIDSRLPDLVIDSEAMSRVLENVIENAVIYNAQGGAVEVSGRMEDEDVVIVVSDTGIGISKNELSHIGEKFFRSGGAKKHIAEGTGLGVFTAREIVKMHKGSIVYASEEGKGTSVTIRLPFVSGNESKAEESAVHQQTVPEGRHARMQEKKETTKSTGTILYIDDDMNMQTLIAERFSAEGIPFISAKDGKEGIQKALKTAPSLILLNMLLPGRDGFSVLEELKRDKKLKSIPVVILSNLAQRHEVQKGLSMGAVLYLIKTNCTPAQIVDEVKRVLAGEN
ncbi:MAG: ATP-binding protein [bacterium]|nr:ATP-binding protein [bacterium]